MKLFQFENNDYLYLLLIIPVLAVLFFIAMHRKKKAMNKFGNTGIITPLMPEMSRDRPLAKFILFTLALITLILAIARPQYGSKIIEVESEGIEMVIALDVSSSMMAEDVKPNRLEAAKLAIYDFVDQLGGDKVGLVVFAADAYIQMPITTDYGAIRMMTEGINTNMVSAQGTAIGNAIEKAKSCFSDTKKSSKAIVIITDGENHEDDALAAAEEVYKNQGIRIYTIGIGRSEGAPIPVDKPYGQRDYKTDKEGKTIISKLNEAMLSQLANKGGGKFTRAATANIKLQKIVDHINTLQKEKLDTKKMTDYEDKFYYFIGIALFLLLIEFIILERKNRIFQKSKLFKV